MKIKKLALAMIFLLLALLTLSAEDWWVGQPMTAFRYNGLQNVTQKTVDNLLSRYVGQPFSDSLFDEINATLYSQSWLSYVYADALNEDGQLVIMFNFFENPMISSITYEGRDRIKERLLRQNQEYEKKGYFTPGRLKANAQALQDYYVSEGYMDAVVTADYTENFDNNTVHITYHISEGKQYRVREIIYEGNDSLTAKELGKVMTQKRKTLFNAGKYVKANLDTDSSSIETLYASKGFPDAKVTNIDVTPTGEEDEKVIYVNVTITIEEGERWTIGSISFTGNQIFSDKDLKDLVKIEKGDPYNVADIMSLQMSLASLYYDNGYIRSNVNFNEVRDTENHIIDFVIEIREGPQSIVEEVVITGLTRTKSRVLEREMKLHAGDIFSRDKLIKSQQNLMNTGLLSSVKADLLYGETPDGVIVEITVEEGNHMELQFGATFGGTVDGFPIAGFVQWTDKNLRGTARNLSVSSTISPTTQSVSISLSDGWVGNKRWSNGISFSFQHSYRDDTLQRGWGSGYYDGRDEDYETFPLGYTNAAEWYSSDYPVYPSDAFLMTYHYWKFGIGYNTGYTFQFNPGNLTLSAGISFSINRAFYDDNKFDPYEKLIKKYHDAWQWSNKLTLGITWDGRDLVQNTTKGYLLSLTYTYAGGFLGGLSNYNKVTASAAGYVSLTHDDDEDGRPKNLVLTIQTSASFMFDQFWNNDDGWDWYVAKAGATKYEMLYIDGMNIGRGFDTIYDKSFLWNNEIDLTYPVIYQVLALEGFVSATGVVSYLDELDDWNNLDWYFAIGGGIKMLIPGFPLGLYLVKNATWTYDQGFEWDDGYLFGNQLKLVLAITTSLY